MDRPVVKYKKGFSSDQQENKKLDPNLKQTGFGPKQSMIDLVFLGKILISIIQLFVVKQIELSFQRD